MTPEDHQESDPNPSVSLWVKEMSHLRFRLETLSSVILATTFANFLTLVLAATIPTINRYTFLYLPSWSVVPISLCIALISLLALRRFELIRDRGRLVLSEVSNELSWSATGYQLSTASKPDLNLRIELREFSLHEKLPLAPRNGGEAVYAVFNIGLTIFTILIAMYAFGFE